MKKKARQAPSAQPSSDFTNVLRLLGRRGGFVFCSLKDLEAFVEKRNVSREEAEEFEYKKFTDQGESAQSELMERFGIPLEKFKQVISGREAALAHSMVNQKLFELFTGAQKVYATMEKNSAKATWSNKFTAGDNFEGYLIAASPVIFKPERCEHPVSKITIDWESNGFFRCNECGERGLKPLKFGRA